jgi:hypothetical protein
VIEWAVPDSAVVLERVLAGLRRWNPDHGGQHLALRSSVRTAVGPDPVTRSLM